MLLISIKNIHRKRLTSISFNKFNKKKIRLTERYVVSVFYYQEGSAWKYDLK